MQVAELAARAAKAAQAADTKVATGKTSRYYGVGWHKKNCNWRAEVRADGKMHHIGGYDDEVAAARDVDKWLLANGERRVNLDADDTPLERQSN